MANNPDNPERVMPTGVNVNDIGIAPIYFSKSPRGLDLQMGL
jgi:hypothetical protein